MFADAAARQLADDLRRVQVQQPDGTTETTLGPFIEPVQLQVVCRRLWDNLAADDLSIDVDDLAGSGRRGHCAARLLRRHGGQGGRADGAAPAGAARVGGPPADHRERHSRAGVDGLPDASQGLA